MGGYGVFAEFYDRLTTDVAYGSWADYLLSLFEKHGRGRPETLLDLACGSGSLSLELASRGVDVIGVDGSEDMLSLAMVSLIAYATADLLRSKPIYDQLLHRMLRKRRPEAEKAASGDKVLVNAPVHLGAPACGKRIGDASWPGTACGTAFPSFRR